MSTDDLRERYLQSQIGDLTQYAALLGESFSSRINLLAQLIHNNHAPSIGS